MSNRPTNRELGIPNHITALTAEREGKEVLYLMLAPGDVMPEVVRVHRGNEWSNYRLR